MPLRKNLWLKESLVHSYLTTALLWGALWGLSEATFGYLLHAVRIPGLAGFVMFPLGIFFMLKAYRDSKSLSVAFSTALVATAIKLSDLMMPGTSTLDIFRPAMAIMTESLAVIALLSIIESKALQRQLI